MRAIARILRARHPPPTDCRSPPAHRFPVGGPPTDSRPPHRSPAVAWWPLPPDDRRHGGRFHRTIPVTTAGSTALSPSRRPVPPDDRRGLALPAEDRQR